jgi:hypothetical protein
MEKENAINKPSKEQVESWDLILDSYELSIGLGQYKHDSFNENEINQYCLMSRDQIEKLTPDDCVEISFRLAQFSLHLQRTGNRELARYNWAEETIKETIADEINNYKGYGYIEKSLQAIKNNSKACTLNKIKKYAKQRCDRLGYLASNIKNLSDIILQVHKLKKQQAAT